MAGRWGYLLSTEIVYLYAMLAFIPTAALDLIENNDTLCTYAYAGDTHKEQQDQVRKK